MLLPKLQLSPPPIINVVIDPQISRSFETNIEFKNIDLY